MIYYANGCSYTWGGELFHFYYEDIDVFLPEHKDHIINQKRLETVYTHHLGKMIGAEKVINEAMSCGSNFRIVRKTLEYFNNLILEDKPINNHFVTIQWTDPSRWEYYDTYAETWILQTNQNSVFEKRLQGNNHCEEQRNYYYKNFHSIINEYACFINHVFCLGNFFKANNIPYLFFKHSGWDSHFYNEKVVELEKLKKLLLQFNWVNDNPITFHMDLSGINSVKGSHPNEQGHIQWAEILYNDINKKNLLKL